MTTAGEGRGELPGTMPVQPAGAASTVAAGPPGQEPARQEPARQEPAGPEPASRGPDEMPEAHGHQHKDVSGGWLRPAVFGAMDGLVTNASLIAGVGGGGGSARMLVLTGLAGLAAGAFSMGSGEYVSVSSQNELVEAEVRKERHELEVHPDAEREELAAMLQHRGIDPELASQVAKQISTSPEEAL